MAAKKPKVTYRQEDGDDGYCYVVRVDGRVIANGLNRSMAKYYADQEKAKHQAKHKESE